VPRVLSVGRLGLLLRGRELSPRKMVDSKVVAESCCWIEVESGGNRNEAPGRRFAVAHAHGYGSLR
jgi:hypothetical protein